MCQKKCVYYIKLYIGFTHRHDRQKDMKKERDSFENKIKKELKTKVNPNQKLIYFININIYSIVYILILNFFHA